ncbi:hypothetical protein Bbelb_282850 [Branchiostoma belcheri]|nr:hypothetical protein Bbelb_282850 [Branchiostoma belcheri]
MAGKNTLFKYFARRASTSHEPDDEDTETASTTTDPEVGDQDSAAEPRGEGLTGGGPNAAAETRGEGLTGGGPNAAAETRGEGLTGGPTAAGKTQKRIRKYVFVEAWKSDRPWLRHVTEGDVETMVCDWCKEFDKSGGRNSFVTGCTTMKISSVTAHENSATHKAVQEKRRLSLIPRQERPLPQAVRRMEKQDMSQLQTLFRTAFYLAKNGRPFTDFKGLMELQKCNGIHIVEALEQDLGQVDWRHKLVAAGVDGANVMMGHVSGVVTRLKNLSSGHQTIYKFYKNSPLNLASLKATGDTLNCPALKPVNTVGTRWIGHVDRALGVVDKSYQALVTHLEQVVEAGTGDSKSKARGILQTVKSAKFVMFLKFLLYIIKFLSSLSSCFQQREVSLEMVRTKVETVKAKMEELSGDKRKLRKKMMEGIETDDNQRPARYKTVGLTHARGRGQEESVVDVAESVVSSLSFHLDGRFKDTLLNNAVLYAGLIFDPTLWPPGDGELDSYGEEEVSTIFAHYKETLERTGHSLEDCLLQWAELKRLVKRKLTAGHIKYLDLWQEVMRHHLERFRDILALVQIVLLFPLSTAECERGFSLMKRIKSDWRSRLTSDTVTALMAISLSPTTVDTFNPDSAIAKWWSAGKAPRRPKTRPYGKRPRQDEADDETSSSSGSESEM